MREVPDWHEYFMEIAIAASKRSKDPSTQVGAAVVDKYKHVIGLGYNGFPKSFKDSRVRWSKKLKYDFVVHAELNAILNATKPVRGCDLYVTMFPCAHCAKHIATAGVKNIYYLDDKYFNDISKKIFVECGVKYRKLDL